MLPYSHFEATSCMTNILLIADCTTCLVNDVWTFISLMFKKEETLLKRFLIPTPDPDQVDNIVTEPYYRLLVWFSAIVCSHAKKKNLHEIICCCMGKDPNIRKLLALV
ncbi:hypothetical protein GDO81_025324 [Engystomops pustulosus]|uniref:Uncharacterized protein n=1 Tax=Engystomops pustulosus TaxID=76066 RepID=A0AAV6YHG9_ENGPU|nr:hypothetical protein GDO81_025324 [Engystomops pustulosus]